MNHARRGSGQPLVLIHGIGSRLQVWSPVVEALSQSHDVIAADVPGFGQSPALPSGVEPTVHAFATAFERFFGELGIPTPHVAGNSMGGGIALELGRRGAARSVTAISPVGFWTPRERRFCQLSLGSAHGVPEPVRRAALALSAKPAGRTLLMGQEFARPWLIPPAEARATLEDFWAAPAFARALAAFDRYTFRDGHELRVPVSVLWGSRDLLLLYGRQAPRARRALPAARHVTLAGLGHTPFYDDPEAVAREMLAAVR
ncbi:MAG: alpha/beta hydrolase [Thermoleophilaceae bacterium]|nr:alpha/beta hydrolase [Thermoleophilaceae bacterium]